MKLRFFRFLSLALCFATLVNLFSCKTASEVFDNECYVFKNQTDCESYFIRIDSIENSNISGRIYRIDNEIVLQPQAFLLVFNKKKSEVILSDTTFYILNFKKLKKGRIEGYFLESSHKKKFLVYPCETDEYQVFHLGRYRNDIFEVKRIPDVSYAKVRGFWTSIPDDTIDVANIMRVGFANSLKKRDLDLDMDIYIPKDDTLEKRPLIMFIHGGAFFIGDKATLPYKKWCTHFASLGYVCVSINYRLGFRINSKAIQRTAYQATQDAHAAMRYLLSKKDIYRIDPDYLFVAGASAGSITALNLAYMRNKDRPEATFASLFMDDLGDIETSGNDCKADFKIKAVANLWGAMHDLEILKNANASIISFHGDEDGVLPYGLGYPFRALGEFQKVFFDEMYGSYYIDKTAQKLGIRSKLHTFEGEGHTLHFDENRRLNDNFYAIQDEIVDFFYEELNPNPVFIIQDKGDCQLFTIDTTGVISVDWNVVGGIAIEESMGSVRAAWFDDELYHELRVSGYYKNGTGFEDVFVIKNIVENEDNTY